SVNSKADYEAWQSALIEGEFQYKDGVMDMGPLERADQETFLGAVLWQTNKSLKNPFKSLLKLVLVDKYANQPNCELLAERVRAYVHENPDGDERTDPDLCLFEAAAGYLQEKRDFDGVRLACESYFSKTISEVDSGSKARMTISDVE